MEHPLEEIPRYFEQERIRLAPRTFLVWVVLLVHSQQHPRMAQLSLSEISQKTGIKSRSAILRALQELEENQMVSKIRADKKYSLTNLYLLRDEWKNA